MKTDLRIIKSRAAIENAFINLVEIRGFQNITITEVAEKAMVNRNTIYLNYGTKEEILESIVKSSFERHFGEINKQKIEKITGNRKKIENFYKNLFKFIDENIELYRIILTDTASAGYLETETKKITKKIENLFKPDEKNKIKYTFLVNGVLGILKNYITLATGTPEENIQILTDLTLTNIRRLAYIK